MASSALAEFQADGLPLRGGRMMSALQSTPIFRDGNAEEATRPLYPKLSWGPLHFVPEPAAEVSRCPLAPVLLWNWGQSRSY